MKRIVAVSGQISEDLIYRKILTTFFLKTMIVWSRRRMRFRNGARRCRSRLDFHCEHTTATSSPIPTSTTVKINRSMHHLLSRNFSFSEFLSRGKNLHREILCFSEELDWVQRHARRRCLQGSCSNIRRRQSSD